MIHAEPLHQAVAEIAEEVPIFGSMKPETQQSMHKLASIISKKSSCPGWTECSTSPAMRKPCMRKRTATGL